MYYTQNGSYADLQTLLLPHGTMNIAQTKPATATHIPAEPSGANTFTVTATYTAPPCPAIPPANVTPPHFPTFTIESIDGSPPGRP